MDFLTIAGYIFAALAIALGLYLMLRKNASTENTTTATEQAEIEQVVLDNDHSTIINDLDNGRIPVIPRHVRDQIRSAQHAVRPATNTAKPEADDLLADAPAIKADRTDDAFNASLSDSLDDSLSDLPHNSPHTALADSNAEQRHNNDATSNPVMAQQAQSQVQALAESSKPDQDPVEDTFDQALAQLEAATSTEDVAEDHNKDHIEDHTQNHSEDDAEAGSPKHTGVAANQADTSNSTAGQLATGNVDEWQGESALLDAHIEDQERRDDESALAQAEHIVALYVMPNPGRTLSGEQTIHLLRQFGLRYGEMSLFHRFADSDGTGPLMFSVLRYTSAGPSGFDLESLPTEHVEGLAFFLALPSKHAVAGYDTMVSISTLLAREIHGQVYDEHMNQLSPQLREHYRHFVLEYRTPA